MKRIDPFAIDSTVLLCSIYPFIGGDSKGAFIRARVNLKLACLLHERVTLPGSLAIGSPFIRNLLLLNGEFLRESIVTLDLREECNSFRDLVVVKHGESADSALLRVADLFDNACTQTLKFSPRDTENQFKQGMKAFLKEMVCRSRKSSVRDSLEEGLNILENSSEPFTYEFANHLVKNSYISGRIKKVAKLLYSVIGAEVTNSVALIPADIWGAGNINRRVVEDVPFNGSERMIADLAVMEYFSIRSDALDKLTSEDILKIKSEPLTRKYIEELDEAVEEARSSIETSGVVYSEVSQCIDDRAQKIKKSVYRRCNAEQKSHKREVKAMHLLEEAAGTVIPFISTAKKGASSFARSMAKKSSMLSWLDYTSIPISTHVSRYQSALLDANRLKG